MEIIVIALIVLLVFVAENEVYKRLAMKNVTYSMTVSRTEAFEGEEIEVVDEVANGKALPLPWLKTEIVTSRWLEISGSSAYNQSDTRFVPSVFMLHGHSKCTRTRRMKCVKRGIFSFSETGMTVTDFFGTVTVSSRVANDIVITVLPKPSNAAAPRLSDRELLGSLLVRRFICEDPFLVSGAREYTGREPLSRIHWNGTARQGKLMAMSNDYTTDNNVLFVFNMERVSSVSMKPIHNSRLEDFIHTAAYLQRLFLENGIRFGLFANGGGEDGEPVFIRSGSGGTHYYHTLRVMSGMKDTVSEMPEYALNRIPLGEFTDVVFFTAAVDGRISSFVRSLSGGGRNATVFSSELSEGSPLVLNPIEHFTPRFYS